MTAGFHYEEFEVGSGQTMFIEEYAEKPYFTKWWRYGVVNVVDDRRYVVVYGSMLRTKPRRKQLIEKY